MIPDRYRPVGHQGEHAAPDLQGQAVGSRPTVTVDGVARPARTKVEHGVTYSYATVEVTPGQTVSVTV